eukprot:931570-Pelagomonas_calceolata.AAC.1
MDWKAMSALEFKVMLVSRCPLDFAVHCGGELTLVVITRTLVSRPAAAEQAQKAQPIVIFTGNSCKIVEHENALVQNWPTLSIRRSNNGSRRLDPMIFPQALVDFFKQQTSGLDSGSPHKWQTSGSLESGLDSGRPNYQPTAGLQLNRC